MVHMSSRSLRKTFVAGRAVGPGTAAQIHAAPKREAGGMVDAVPPSEEAVRAAITEGKCPFCGSGPWKMLPVHTNKVHGVDKWQLRDLAGLTTAEPLCDAETRAKMRAAALRHPDAVKRATAASMAPGAKRDPRQTRAGRAKKREHLNRWMDEHPDEIAQLRAEFRDRMTSAEATARWLASMARVRAERVVTPEQRAEFAARMSAPDVEVKRAARRAETRIDTCTVEGCDAAHVARGYCRRHWSRWQREQVRERNKRRACVVCGSPMDPQRATRKYCSTACSSRAARRK